VGKWDYVTAQFHGQGYAYSGGTFTDIVCPGAIETIAHGIKDASDIVRFTIDTNIVGHGFLYSGGSYSYIDHPGPQGTYATDINDVGQIVGWYADNNLVHQGFVYRAGIYEPSEYPVLRGKALYRGRSEHLRGGAPVIDCFIHIAVLGEGW
jgi:probable HAF family extracellular repeat protein